MLLYYNIMLIFFLKKNIIAQFVATFAKIS
jgi:hypothetical protein